MLCFNYVDFHTSGGYDEPMAFVPERWQTTDRKAANYIPFGIKEARSCPAQHMATLWLREIWFAHVHRNVHCHVRTAACLCGTST